VAARHQQNGRFEEMECRGRNQRRDIMSKTEAFAGFVNPFPCGQPPIPEYLSSSGEMVRGSTTSTEILSGQFVRHLVCFMYHCRQRNDGDVLPFAVPVQPPAGWYRSVRSPPYALEVVRISSSAEYHRVVVANGLDSALLAYRGEGTTC
jgi:hypothetical protein